MKHGLDEEAEQAFAGGMMEAVDDILRQCVEQVSEQTGRSQENVAMHVGMSALMVSVAIICASLNFPEGESKKLIKDIHARIQPLIRCQCEKCRAERN